MIGFLDIEKIILPKEKATKAYAFLRKVGKEKLEGVGLFVGKQNKNKFEITNTIIPEQKALSIESGLLYSVDGDELHRINIWLYKNNLRLIAQIHSHPREAFHSKTDDAFPIVATVGGISMVVPDFAIRPLNIKDWAIYRLSNNQNWVELYKSEIEDLFQII